MNEKQMLFAYDRRRTSTLTLDEQPGAHTGATRKYIPGYSDANIVFLNTDTGNDGNTGASIAQAVLTYAQAATLAGSTKKIRLVNSATLSTNITKPTEATIGTTSSIASSLTAPVDTWTQAGTGISGSASGVIWAPALSLYIAVGGSGMLWTSPDGDVWTSQSSGFGSSDIYSIAWSDSLGVAVAVGNAKIGISSDGITWEVFPTNDFIGVRTIWDDVGGRFVSVGKNVDSNVAKSATSIDGITWVIETVSSIGVDYFNDVVYASHLGLYIAVANRGKTATSSNGMSWSISNTWGSIFDVYTVGYSDTLSKIVAADATGVIRYSTNGTTWTTSATSLGASASTTSFVKEIGAYLMSGGVNIIKYSFDGDTWSDVTNENFSSSAVLGFAYSVKLQRVVAAGSNSKIGYSTAFASTISAHVAGFTIQAMQYSGTITAYNCTFRQPGTTAALSLENCRVEYDSHISNNAATSRATLYRGDRHLTCTPAAQNDIDLNLDTWGGTFYIYNASQTGFERIRDCLGAGPIVANYPVTVTGRANIEGDLVNVLTGAEVSFNDVSFVDTTDYKLEFQTNGYSRNSFAAGRSNLYFNSAGDQRDIGAWSYVESAVSYYFAKSEYIDKGEIVNGLEFQLNEQQGDSGVVNVYGNTRRVKEVINMAWGTTYKREKHIFERMLELTDKTVKIRLDVEFENAGTVTVNGNQSAGVEFLTVDAVAYFEGMKVTVAGRDYYVMRVSPSPSAATHLILNEPLRDAVSDNDVLVTNYPDGDGEYQFAGPVLMLKRVDSSTLLGYYTGFQIRLVRKKQ